MTTHCLLPEELDLLARARLTALSSAPYFANALMAITFVRSEGLKTLAVDRRLRVYIDPAVLEMWSTVELAGVLLHEVNHVIRGHHDRQVACGISPSVWNMGADLEINDDLANAGIYLPSGALLPEMFGYPDGELAETYAGLLLQDHTVSVELHCGSGAGGIIQGHELGDDNTVPGISPVQLEGIRDVVAREVTRSREGLSAGIARWADAHFRSNAPWPVVLGQAVLRAAPRGVGHHRHSWSRPRRHNPTRALLPSLRAVPMHVAVIVDSSGSMEQDHLDQAATDIRLLRAMPSIERLTVVACDVKVTKVHVPRLAKPISFVGGGGTSLDAGLDFAAELRPHPDLVVIITDGLTDWPETAPSRLPQVIAVMPHGSPPGPKWMMTITRAIGTRTVDLGMVRHVR